jgi:LysM repeat protein
MNTPSPLVPQGTTPAKGKSTFFFKVVMILSVHVVLIGGMLLQGCKDTTKDTTSTTPSPDTSTTSTSPSSTDTLPPVASTQTLSNAAVAQIPVTPVSPTPMTAPPTLTSAPPTTLPTAPVAPMTTTTPVTAPTSDSKEYVVAAHDTLGAIARHNGVSLKALLEANPGVNPRKLQVGQKLQLPGSSAVASATTSGAADATAPTPTTATDSDLYVVKSGDTLSRIAKANHTSYKKIMALNELKTTSIHVGQKLKLPGAKATTEATAAPLPTTPVVPLQPTPVSSTTASATPVSAAN